MRKIVYVIWLVHLLNACIAQQGNCKNLTVNIVENQVQVSCEIKNISATDVVYITYGFKNNDTCQIFDEVYNLNVPASNRNDVVYHFQNGIMFLSFPLRQASLKTINYARLCTSNNKGEYSKYAFYKNSKKLSELPCDKAKP